MLRRLETPDQRAERLDREAQEKRDERAREERDWDDRIRRNIKLYGP